MKRLEDLEKKVAELEKKLDKNSNSIKITFYSNKKGNKTFIYDNYDQEKIKKDLNIKYLFECFTKGNYDLHCAYYTDSISNIRQLVISDNYEKLQYDIIELGMCE